MRANVAILGVVIFNLALLVGCSRREATPANTAKTATPDVAPPIRLVVVDDPNLATSIAREWASISTTPLEISEVDERTWMTMVRSSSEPADAAVFSTRLLGDVAECDAILPLPQRYLTHEDLQWNDVLPLTRRVELVWGASVYALPFGSPQPVVAVPSASVPEAPWRTWAAWDAWVLQLPKATTVTMPLSDRWATDLFLMRVASYIGTDGQLSSYFDFQTMEPLIDQPPFVRALNEWASLVKAKSIALDVAPAEVAARVMQGNATGIVWWGCQDRSTDAAEDVDLAFLPLPGSDDVFSFSARTWQPRKSDRDPRVSLVAWEGRCGCVLKRSRRQRAAWNLLVRVAGSELSGAIASSSAWTGPCRASHLDQVDRWMPSALAGAAARQYAEAIRQNLTRHTTLTGLRMPQQARYRETLDQAVQAVLRGDATAQDALQKVAESWRSITQSLGMEAQKAAYARSLRIDP